MTASIPVSLLLSLTLVTNAAWADETLQKLATVGPWPGVSRLVGFRNEVWFVNSVKFVNHNSADIYSYDPESRQTHYRAHLFSQDAGTPVVHNGLLYWPFEDARFSMGRAEFMVTNGVDWEWRTFNHGQAFHMHAMIGQDDRLVSATSAWRAGLHESRDEGVSWQQFYDHETPPGRVSRIASLAEFNGAIYGALTSRSQPGPKLLRATTSGVETVPHWPHSQRAAILGQLRGWLYVRLTKETGDTVWRTDGERIEEVTALRGVPVLDMDADNERAWSVSGQGRSGTLLTSRDGLQWSEVQSFESRLPVDVLVYNGNVFVGVITDHAGELWGTSGEHGGLTEPEIRAIPKRITPLTNLEGVLQDLDRSLAGSDRFDDYRLQLEAALLPLQSTGDEQVGHALAERLLRHYPEHELSVFGNLYTTTTRVTNVWYLLRAMALNGRGLVPLELLTEAWEQSPNRAEKYFHPAPAAAWVIGRTNFHTQAHIETLLKRLDDRPGWLVGDWVGALTAITGQTYGYDADAWRRWWNRNRAMAQVPSGTFLMGSEAGPPSETPVHPVTLDSFFIDQTEVTNAAFESFVQETGYITDTEKKGWGWHWESNWRKLSGADWRHPHGPGSDIEGLSDHPVVQVSWNDAVRYCQWRGARLPTEAEWEKTARFPDSRKYAWGNASPADGGSYGLASYGSDRCCAASDSDGHRFTAPVGSYPGGRSHLSVDDLTGNVWEWVQDSFESDFYASSPARNPVNHASDGPKVIRGGGWGNNPEGLTTTLRHANPASYGLSMVGFRCAR